MTNGDQSDQKAEFRIYLQRGREALLWKLDGLSEYDVRRPLTQTGTNLLGLVKHLTLVEGGYLGPVFNDHFDEPLPWREEDEAPNADMWATAEESREDLIEAYRQVWALGDATIERLPLDARGYVPWWPEERNRPTLHRILVHVIAELHRHTGHADIVRELVDGSAGASEQVDNLPAVDRAWWASYREKVEQTAREAGGVS